MGKCIAFLIIVPIQNKKVLCGDGLRYKRLLGGNVEEGIKSLRFWKRVGKTNGKMEWTKCLLESRNCGRYEALDSLSRLAMES